MIQLGQNEMETHVTLLGWLHIAGNIVILLVGLCVFVFLIGIGSFVTDDFIANRILTIVGAFVAIVLTTFALPGIVAGYGLLRRQSWARILSMIVAFFGLLNFPLGTALGIYSFYVLLQDEAQNYFK